MPFITRFYRHYLPLVLFKYREKERYKKYYFLNDTKQAMNDIFLPINGKRAMRILLHIALFIYKCYYYTFIAFAPKAPSIAEATAITTFKILSQTVFFIVLKTFFIIIRLRSL